ASDFDLRARFWLNVEGDPSLALLGKGEKTYMATTLSEDALTLADGSGDERAHLGLNKDGAPRLAFFGKGAKTYDETFLDENGLTVCDENRSRRAVLGRVGLETVRTGATETTAPGSLTLFDKKGHVIWRVPPE